MAETLQGEETRVMGGDSGAEEAFESARLKIRFLCGVVISAGGIRLGGGGIRGEVGRSGVVTEGHGELVDTGGWCGGPR